MQTFYQILSVVLAVVLLYVAVVLGKYLIRAIYNKHRTLNMVFLRVMIPKKESKEDREEEQASLSGQRDFKEIVGVGSHLFESLHSIYNSRIRAYFMGQDFFSIEYAVLENQIHFYFVVPRALKSLIEKQITSFYPDCYVEQVQDYNIFKKDSKVAACNMELSKKYFYPIKTYENLNSDPLNNLTNVLSKLSYDDGASIQIMLRPMKNGWQKKGREEAKNIFTQKRKRISSWNPITWLGALFDFFFKGEVGQEQKPEDAGRTTPLTDEEVKAMEQKNSKVGYETIIRIVTSSPTEREANSHLDNIVSAFVQYSSPNANGFTMPKIRSERAVIRNYILRSFKRTLRQLMRFKKNVLSADEVVSLFHLPNIRYNKAPTIGWQNFKIAPAPHNIPKEGILIGHNHYRGETREIRMKNEDRFRHFYVIGQTGTGKSSILQVMIRQDLKNGNGLAVVDPHGSLIEDIIPFIPRERADDVIYFNPSDLERPLG